MSAGKPAPQVGKTVCVRVVFFGFAVSLFQARLVQWDLTKAICCCFSSTCSLCPVHPLWAFFSPHMTESSLRGCAGLSFVVADARSLRSLSHAPGLTPSTFLAHHFSHPPVQRVHACKVFKKALL